MKHITRLADTKQVRLMVEALQKAFDNNPKVKFEVDYQGGKHVRVTKEGFLRPLYMALCKDGNVWMTSYPEDLFI